MKIFHGWRVVGAGALLQVLQGGLMQQSFGAYVAVLAAERGWSKTALSGGAALMSLEAALIGPLIGWLVDKFGERSIIRAGIVIFALGLVSLGLIDSIGGFYMAIVTCAVGMSLCGYFPINVAVIHWFERQRARALSAVGLGVALGGVMVPLVAVFMQAFGWRATAIASGLLVLLAGWPLSAVFKGRPHELGEHVDGVAPAPKPNTEASPERTASPPIVTQPGFTISEAIRTRAFWLLSFGHGAALLVVTAVNVHAITHMKEGMGYTVNEASLVIMLMTLAQIGGVLLGIMIGDRFPKRWVAALAMVGHCAGLLLLAYASGVTMLVGFAVAHGMAWGVRGPFMQAIRADYFGRRAIGMILGVSTVIVSIGQVCGPLVAGVLADLTGDYRLGFTLLSVISVGGAWLFIAATPPVHPSLRPARSGPPPAGI